MNFRLSCCAIFLASSVFLTTPSAATLDVSKTVNWGPASGADSLLVDLRSARWLEDEQAFDHLKTSIWNRFPHHELVLGETVLWHRDHQTLPHLLDALAGDEGESFTGLVGLNSDDKLLLEGYALICAGYLTSGRQAVEQVLASQPHNPLALIVLAWSHPESAAKEEIAARALADPGAAPVFAATLLTLEPEDSLFDYQEDVRAIIAEREPRPGIEVLVVCEDVLSLLRQPGLTVDRLAEMLDEFHGKNPAAFNGFLGTVIRTALIWLSPEAIMDLIIERSEWVSPMRLAKNISILQMGAERGYDSYRTLVGAERINSRVPDRYILRTATYWHPDAAEVEDWARYTREGFLTRPGDWVETILKGRGYPDVADSLRRNCEFENPYTYRRQRIAETAFNDPTAGRALLDSLVSVLGERSFGWHLMMFSEKAGDTSFLDECLTRYGVYWTMRNIQGAIAGARDRADITRLRELHELVREHAPQNTALLTNLARIFQGFGELESANEIIEEIKTINPSSSLLFSLQFDSAVRANDYDAARDIAEQYLAGPDPTVNNLFRIPVFAERAGWPELADRAVVMIEDRAPEGCHQLELLRAEMSRVRGDLDDARVTLLQLQGEWPGSELILRALVETGGIVEAYKDPSQEIVDTSLAGLEFDYTSTDWILAGLATGDEFPGQEFLVLRNRTTYCLWSHTQLLTRTRMTIEILSDPASSQLETMRIPYNADEVMPKILCARIINRDGTVREVPQSQILVTAHQDEEANVSDLRDLVIPFAGLKEGMIVDLCYQTTNSSFLDLGHSWVYQFGHFSPQREETVEFIIAAGVDHLLYQDHQPVAGEIKELKDARLHRYNLVDQPSLHIEEMVDLSSLYPHWVGCTTYDSWDQLARYYGKVFWENAKSNGEMGDLAKRLTEGHDEEGDRAEQLFSYIQDEVTNIGIELGPGRFIPTPSHEVIARGYGDCKDKVAALISLASEMGLNCLPVLVGTRPSLEIEDGFPSSAGFNHLIAYFPDLNGGTFADPTLGSGCLGDITEEVAGQRGLLIHPDGAGELVQIPEASSEYPRVELEVDLYPEEGGNLRAEAVALIHFGAGGFISDILDNPDTTLVHSFINLLLGNQIADEMPVLEWSKRHIGCGSLEIKAVLRDTMWASPDDNDASIIWVTATDAEVELPSEKERKYSLVIDTAKKFKTVIRAHEGAGLRLSPRHAPIKESGPGFRGEVTVKERKEGDSRWLEIRREVEFSQREYSPVEFEKLRDKYFSFRIAGFQPIQYYRLSDEARMEQMRSYCRENPDDLAFSYQAARQVLGGDIGGDGEVGIERRVLARELLAPALQHPDVGGIPFMLAASMAVRDNRYLEADSLMTEGLERSPRDLYLLSYANFVATELGEDEKQAEYLLRLQNISGSEWPSYSLIGHFLSVEDDEKAEKEEYRLHIISAAVDSVQLIQTKINGYTASNRMELVEELLPVAQRQLGEEDYFYILANVAAQARRWDEAIDRLMPAHSEYSLSSVINNKMAWYLACAGRDLERAEYLARMVIALDGNSAPIDNTLAVVLMRQGKKKEAEEIFTRLMLDERPSHQVVNGYFYGLLRWMEGDRKKAIESWRSVEDLIPSNRDMYSMVIKESLEAVDKGEDPVWIYLRPLEEE